MDRRSFLKHVARATAVAGAANAAHAANAANIARWQAAAGPADAPAAPAAAADAPSAPAAAPAGAPSTSSAGPAAAAPAFSAAVPERLTLVGAGDCILSRRVRDLRHPDFLALTELVRGADCAWGNCEIVIGDGADLYPAWKGIDLHTLGDPWAADELRWMGFRLMGTANNHTVDYGHRGLASTCTHLDRVGIAHAGSGADLDEAARPAFADTAAGRVGLVSSASTFPDYFAAAPANPHMKGRPGLNPLRVKPTIVLDDVTFQHLRAARKTLGELWAEGDYQSMGLVQPSSDPRKFDFADITIATGDRTDYQSAAVAADLKRIADAVALARGTSRAVVVSIHAHEARHKLETSDLFLETFAHAAIDAGADVYFSSGPHVLRGIEIYKGKPIFYSLSNFFFQLATARWVPSEDYTGEGLDARTADPATLERHVGFPKQARFWQSVLPRITFERDRVSAVELFPLTLGFTDPPYLRGTPRLARGPEADAILRGMAVLSAPYGTVIEVHDGIGSVRLAG